MMPVEPAAGADPAIIAADAVAVGAEEDDAAPHCCWMIGHWVMTAGCWLGKKDLPVSSL